MGLYKGVQGVSGRREVALSRDHRKFQILVWSWKVPAVPISTENQKEIKFFLYKRKMNAKFAQEAVIYTVGPEVTK